MRPRPAKDEAVRPEDPEQVKGVSDGVHRVSRETDGTELAVSRQVAEREEWRQGG